MCPLTFFTGQLGNQRPLLYHVGVETPVMDALIALGAVIMGKDCLKEGRNLDKLGLAGMDLKQIKSYLENGR